MRVVSRFAVGAVVVGAVICALMAKDYLVVPGCRFLLAQEETQSAATPGKLADVLTQLNLAIRIYESDGDVRIEVVEPVTLEVFQAVSLKGVATARDLGRRAGSGGADGDNRKEQVKKQGDR